MTFPGQSPHRSGSRFCKTPLAPSLDLWLDAPLGIWGKRCCSGSALRADRKNLPLLDVLLTFSPGNIVFKSYLSKSIYPHLLMLKMSVWTGIAFSGYCWKDLLVTVSARVALWPAPPSPPARSWRVVLSREQLWKHRPHTCAPPGLEIWCWSGVSQFNNTVFPISIF